MKKLFLISFFCLSASTAFLFFDISGAKAVSTTTWIGGTTGNWSDAAKWDNGVPTASVDALISTSTSAITVTADATINFSSLQLGGETQNVTLTLTQSIGTGTNIILKDKATLTQNNAVAQTITGELKIESGGKLNHTANGNTAQGIMYKVDFSAATVTVDSGGSINVDGKGYAAVGNSTGNGPGPGYHNSSPGGGGANGGNGGSDEYGGRGGTGYCNLADPSLTGLGSSGGAGNGYTSNAGGGLIVLNVSGTLTVNGTITADGNSTLTNGGGGAGGSLKITANTIAGTPSSLTLVGGGSSGSGGGGGGGCALITYTTSNSISPTGAYFSMYGGAPNNPGPIKGGAGQVLVKQASANGDLYIVNTATGATTTPLYASSTFDSVTINSYALFEVLAGKILSLATGSSVSGSNTSGGLKLYGTLNFSSGTLSLTGVNLYIYNGGAVQNSATVDVTSTGGLYLYGGALLNSGSVTVLNSTGTLYMASGGISSITTLNSAGTTSLYQGFTSSLGTLNINSGTATMYNYTTTNLGLRLTNLNVNNGSTLTHSANGTTAQGQMHIVNVLAADSVAINSGGTVSANSKGYAAPSGSWNGGNGPGGATAGVYLGGGGGHGGAGAGINGGTGKGAAYCDVNNPATIGSSGGGAYTYAAGGGLILISATSTITVNGAITATGGGSVEAAGAGGGVKLLANIIAGTPTSFTVVGGNGSGSANQIAGGGGGCVNLSYSASNSIATGQVTKTGGTGGSPASGVGLFQATQLNQAPVATAISPAQSGASVVTFTTTVSDGDLNATSLAVQYSTDNSSWNNAALGAVTASVGTVSTSTGSITSIDTNVSAVDLTIEWYANIDLPNTEDSTVYLRVTPNDGTIDGSTQTSSAFALDTKAPSAPGNLTAGSQTTTAVTLTYGSASTDANFSEYKIYYDTGTPTVSSASWTSANSASLGSISYSGASTVTISPLNSGTTYNFIIVAYDTFGRYTSCAASVAAATQASPATVGISSSGSFTPPSVSSSAPVITVVPLETTTGQIGGTSALSSGVRFINGEATLRMKFSVANAVYMALSNTADFKNQHWRPYASTIDWTLSPGDGKKTVYIKFSSVNGGETPVYTQVVDVEEPKATTPVTPEAQEKPAVKPATPESSETKKTDALEKELTPPVVSVTPGFVFKRYLAIGSKGADVRELQKLLKDLGYYKSSDITGNFDQVTTDAVKKFQVAERLSPLGYVGPLTRSTLNREVEEAWAKSAPAEKAVPAGGKQAAPSPSSEPPKAIAEKQLNPGNSNSEVKQLQEALKDLGFLNINQTTSYFGQATKRAVVQFQQAQKLPATGVADVKTIQAANAAVATASGSGGFSRRYVFDQVLKFGAYSGAVTELQKRLKDYGFFQYKEFTGYFGYGTQNGVFQYQKSRKLKLTGIIDAATMAELNKVE